MRRPRCGVGCRPSWHTARDETIDCHAWCSLIVTKTTRRTTSSLSGYYQADIVKSEMHIGWPENLGQSRIISICSKSSLVLVLQKYVAMWLMYYSVWHTLLHQQRSKIFTVVAETGFKFLVWSSSSLIQFSGFTRGLMWVERREVNIFLKFSLICFVLFLKK